MTTDISIVNVPITDLHELPDNPNRMDERQYALLVEAIRQLGFVQPVLTVPRAAGGYSVVDGAHRTRAAAEAGMTHVPAVVVAGRDDAYEIIARIGMNRLRGELDLTSVGTALKSLVEKGWSASDLTVTGFSAGEVHDLMRSVAQDVESYLPRGGPDPDDFEDAPAPEATKPWVLEIAFKDREAYKKARRGLRRAAGKGKDLSEGLLRLLGDEREKKP